MATGLFIIKWFVSPKVFFFFFFFFVKIHIAFTALTRSECPVQGHWEHTRRAPVGTAIPDCTRPGSKKSAAHQTAPAHSPLARTALLCLCGPSGRPRPGGARFRRLQRSAGPPPPRRRGTRGCVCRLRCVCLPLRALTDARAARPFAAAALPNRVASTGVHACSRDPVFPACRCTRPTRRRWSCGSCCLRVKLRGLCLSSRPGMERHGRR